MSAGFRFVSSNLAMKRSPKKTHDVDICSSFVKSLHFQSMWKHLVFWSPLVQPLSLQDIFLVESSEVCILKTSLYAKGALEERINFTTRW